VSSVRSDRRFRRLPIPALLIPSVRVA